MFLDDTACNLASLNLLKFYDTDDAAASTSRRSATPCRLWTLILEISVYMAQFPSEPVAQKSYDFRTLGLGYANLGALLDGAGHPVRLARRPGPVRRAHRAHARGVVCHVAPRSPARSGRSRATRPTARRCCASIRNHRRAAYNAPRRRVRRADHHAGRHRSDATARDDLLARGPRANRDRMLELGEKHGYRNAQVTVIAPTGTIGLVMDCDTTGIEPDFALVKFKKLAGGGYFKIINASVPPALARLGYTPKQIDDIVRYCRGAGTLDGCPHINAGQRSRPRASPTRCSQQIEAQLPGAFELPFVFNRWTLGDDFLTRHARASPRSSSTRPASTCSTHLGFTQAADRRGQRLRLRHHDDRRRAAPEAGALRRSSTAPTSAARSASASCRPRRTSA